MANQQLRAEFADIGDDWDVGTDEDEEFQLPTPKLNFSPPSNSSANTKKITSEDIVDFFELDDDDDDSWAYQNIPPKNQQQQQTIQPSLSQAQTTDSTEQDPFAKKPASPKFGNLSRRRLSFAFELDSEQYPVVQALHKLLPSLPAVENNTKLNATKREKYKEWNLSRLVSSFEDQMATTREKNDMLEEIRLILQLGEIYRERGFNAEAYRQFEKGQKKSQDACVLTQFNPRFISLEAECLLNMGKSMFLLKKYPMAEKHLKEAQERLEGFSESPPSNENRCLLAEIGIQQGLCAMNSKEYPKAAEYFTKCLTLVIDSPSDSSRISGDNSSNNNNYSAPRIVNIPLYREACYQIGVCLKELGNLTLAFEYAERAARTPYDSFEDKKEIEAKVNKLIEQLKSELEEKSSKKKTINNFYEDEDEEDWDIEFNLKPESTTSTAPLKNFLFSTEKVEDLMEEELFPAKYSLIKQESQAHQIQAIRYPKSSSLYSLVTAEGQKAFADSKYESWVGSIIGRHLQGGRDEKLLTLVEKTEKALMDSLITELQYVDKFSVVWAQKYYQHCWVLFRFNSKDATTACWRLLIDYFGQLALAKRTEILDEDDISDQIVLFNISLDLLKLAARLWRPEEQQAFENMMNAVSGLAPRQSEGVNNNNDVTELYKDAVTLVEMEALCHHMKLLTKDHKHHRRRIIPTLLRIIDEKFKSPCTELSTLPSIADYSQFYTRVHHRTQPCRVTLSCHAVFILHCFATAMSPLSLSPLDDAWNMQEYSSEFEDSPGLYIDLDGGSSGGGSGYSEEEVYQSQLVSNQAFRIQVLKYLYHSLPCLSVLKAATAALLGLYSRHVECQLDQAEDQLFESVFIFDKMPSLCPETIPSAILSDLGIQSLLEYGEVLLANCKYRYAVLVFECAARCHKIVHDEENNTLIRRLAVLCAENNDWKRALEYYQQIYRKAIRDKNVNEIVYVSEILSGMYLERGDFRSAEDYIVKAIKFAKGNTTQGKTDALALQLQLKLAQLYLHGYYFERGIYLLGTLMSEDLPQIQQCTVMLNLAEAYLKKRWLKECESVINKLGPILDQQLISYKVFGVGTGGAAGSTGGSSDEEKAFALAARCYYHQGRYTYALYWVDEALQRCHPSNIIALGKYFFLKGKIFQSLCKSSTAIYLPSNFQPENIHRHPLYEHLKRSRKQNAGTRDNTTSFSNRPVYNHPGEVLYDCLKFYRKAYDYFRTINDEIRISKTVMRIACAQLDFIFNPIAILRLPLEEVINVEIPAYSNKPSSKETAVGPDQTYITLEAIEQPAALAVDIAVRTRTPILSIEGYVTMAELRCLEGRHASAQRFWTECRDTLFNLFMNGTEVVVSKGSPPGFLARIHRILQRLVRLMFCLNTHEKDFINQNLIVIDSYLQLEIELDQVKKRPVEVSPDPACEDSVSESTAANKDEFAENILLEAIPKAATIPGGTGSSMKSGSATMKSGSKTLRFTSSSGKSGTSSSTIDAINHFRRNRALSAESLLTRNKIYEDIPSAYNTQNQQVSYTSRTLPFLRSRSANSDHDRSITGLMPFTVGPLRMRSHKSLVSSISSGGSSTTNSAGSIEEIQATSLAERIAERAWSCLFRMKQHSLMYSSGTLPESELCRRNESTIKRLQTLMNAMRKKRYSFGTGANFAIPALDSPTSGPDNISEPKSVKEMDKEMRHKSVYSSDLILLKNFFRTMSFENFSPSPPSSASSPSNSSSNFLGLGMRARISNDGSFNFAEPGSPLDLNLLSRLVYILYIEDMVFYYLPRTGKRSVHRFGGRPQVHVSSFKQTRPAADSSSNNTPTPSFQIPPTGRTVSTPRLKITTISEGEGISLDDIDIGGNLAPVGNFESYRPQIAPATISNSNSSGGNESASTKLVDNVAMYIRSLITGQNGKTLHSDAVDSSEDIAKILTHSVFSAPIYAYSPSAPTLSLSNPASPAASLSRTSSTSSVDSSSSHRSGSIFGRKKSTGQPTRLRDVQVTDKPLVLICSHYLQVIPWELMFYDLVTRAFTLQTLISQIDSSRTNAASSTKDRFLPAYFCCFSEDDAKHIGPAEEMRKEWIFKETMYRLNHSAVKPTTFYETLSNLPLHTPLIKYGKKPSSYGKKYKHVHFVELAMLVENSTQVVTHIDSNLGPNQYPVFLFTIADLLDLSETILSLLSYRPDCTFLFIPDGKMREATLYLTQMQDKYIKSGELAKQITQQQQQQQQQQQMQYQSIDMGPSSTSPSSSTVTSPATTMSTATSTSSLSSLSAAPTTTTTTTTTATATPPPSSAATTSTTTTTAAAAAATMMDYVSVGYKFFMNCIQTLHKVHHIPVIVMNPPPSSSSSTSSVPFPSSSSSSSSVSSSSGTS